MTFHVPPAYNSIDLALDSSSLFGRVRSVQMTFGRLSYWRETLGEVRTLLKEAGIQRTKPDECLISNFNLWL